MQQLLVRNIEVPPGASIALLPSPYTTIVRQYELQRVVLYGPHQRVWQLDEKVDALFFCRPNIIKVLFGHPKQYVNKSFTNDELSLLRPFNETPVNGWYGLLEDARASVAVLPDEIQFLKEWPHITSGEYNIETGAHQRQLERICRRYAGQSPSQITQEIRLSRQLVMDIEHQAYQPSGLYADQSHYIRECRKLTGRTPAYWQNLSVTFYTYDGQDVTIRP